jgi:hypothetical protein
MGGPGGVSPVSVGEIGGGGIDAGGAGEGSGEDQVCLMACDMGVPPVPCASSASASFS